MRFVVKDDLAMVLMAILLGYRDALVIRRLIDSSFIDHTILVKALPINKGVKSAPL